MEPINTALEKRKIRKWWCLIAVIAHGVLLLTLTSLVSILGRHAHNSTLLFLLFAQQVVAFSFSLYAYPCSSGSQRDFEFHNTRKWTEYGITATLGTLAIYASSTNSFDALWLILLLSFLSTAEQLLGYELDFVVPENGKFSMKTWYQFGIAWGFQIIEFLLLAVYTQNLAVPVYIVYFLMWSSFGVVCGLRLYFLKYKPTHWLANRWGSELMYTNLGWTSKFSLVVTALPYVVKPFKGLTGTAYIIAIFCLACTGFILYQTQQRAAELFPSASPSVDTNNETRSPDLDLDNFA